MKSISQIINEVIGVSLVTPEMQKVGIVDVKAQKNGQVKIKCKNCVISQKIFDQLLTIGSKWTISGDLTFNCDEIHDVEITSKKRLYAENKNITFNNVTVMAEIKLISDGDVEFNKCLLRNKILVGYTANNKMTIPVWNNCTFDGKYAGYTAWPLTFIMYYHPALEATQKPANIDPEKHFNFNKCKGDITCGVAQPRYPSFMNNGGQKRGSYTEYKTKNPNWKAYM